MTTVMEPGSVASNNTATDSDRRAPAPPKTLADACVPRASVFDPTVRDDVYNLNDLDKFDLSATARFFAETFITDGMERLLTEAFKRLEGRSQSAPGAFLLSQSMGGGKTHNLLALGLLAKYPQFRANVMERFERPYSPGPLGAVRTVSFSGRNTDTPFGLWGEIARQLNKREAFQNTFSPSLRAPSEKEWVDILRGEPVLLLLDELPPYFEQAKGIPVGATTLDTITTTALANLLVAVTNGELPNACVVITDLRSSAYSAGSTAVNQALANMALEVGRGVTRIDPVRLNTNELYKILRVRLFEQLPSDSEIEDIAGAYSQAIDEAHRTGYTTASAPQTRTDILESYPFHPAVRDLYARFKENPGFQQTRALIRIMRKLVCDLWQSDTHRARYLIGAQDLDLHDGDLLSEIQQINDSFATAIAHDIAGDTHGSVAEQIDGPGRSDAQDAARLIFLSSLSSAVDPTLGLSSSDVVAYLASPGRDLSMLRNALANLQDRAWYLHEGVGGTLLFRDTENLVAKQESFVRAMLPEMRESELREQLNDLFKVRRTDCYQDLYCLPALDQVRLTQDRLALIVFRPSTQALADITEFFDHETYKNRVLFLTGDSSQYEQALGRAASLRAIRQIIEEFKRKRILESDPQMKAAVEIETRERGMFYQACRETFQVLLYPTNRGLNKIDLQLQFVANTFDGEEQIVNALREAHKYKTPEQTREDGFRSMLVRKLWPADSKVASWNEIRRRAAADPSWVLYHPRALEDFKAEAIRREVWREDAPGYVDRGPFEAPVATVDVRLQHRNDATMEATLGVRPLHADVVHVSETGPATTTSPTCSGPTYGPTKAVRVSFLAVDSSGIHASGEPVEWTNSIMVRSRFFTGDDGATQMCELQAIPGGVIRYTTNGTSPLGSGESYSAPFMVPVDSRFVQAVATQNGVASDVLRLDVPSVGPNLKPNAFAIAASQPATWTHEHKLDATGETFRWIEVAAKHKAELGGVKLAAVRIAVKGVEQWVEFRAAQQIYLSVEAVREQADRLQGILPGATISLEVDVCRFSQGSDLTSMISALRLSLVSTEVQQ